MEGGGVAFTVDIKTGEAYSAYCQRVRHLNGYCPNCGNKMWLTSDVLGTRRWVAGSAALAFVCEPSAVVAWFALLFVAQLATGPVLSLVYDKVERRGFFCNRMERQDGQSI